MTETDESSMMDLEGVQSQKDEPEPKHYAPKKRLQPKPRPTYQAQVAIPRSGEDTSKGISQLLCMQFSFKNLLYLCLLL